MRIDFVITELNVGGAERCLTELATGLSASGDRVRVLSIGSLPGGEQQVLVDQMRDAGIDVRSCDADSSFQFAAAYRTLRNWFLCQTFLFHANVLGTIAAKSTGVKIRIGGLRVADDRLLRRRVARLVVPRMRHVVCVSDEVEQFAHRRLGCSSDQTVVIPNSFASAVPTRWSTLGWPDDSKVVLFVGRLHSQKGIDLLQDQIDSIAPTGTDRRLLLVGDGPLRKRLELWTNSIGRDRVRLLPWQPNVAPLMRACRLLVLPSRYEGMPNVVLEAMAAGRPVVCSDIEGSKQLLGHARESQVFRTGNSEAMKNLIEQFLSDEDLSEKIGEDNQARARNDFSVAAMVDAYRGFYRTVLAEGLDDL